jgi:anti-anti-sigma factor
MEALVLDTAVIEGGHVVTVSGEIDPATSLQLRAFLAQFRTGDVMVDLSGVGFFDLSGVGVFLAEHGRVTDRGDRFALQNVPRLVRRVLDVLGIDDEFHQSADRHLRLVPSPPQRRHDPFRPHQVA